MPGIIFSNAIFAVTLLFSPLLSQAQSPVKHETSTLSLLAQEKVEADAEEKTVAALLEAENNRTAGNVCVTNALSWRLRSIRWFQKNYSEFQSLEKNFDAKYDAALKEANQKWDAIRSAEFKANPVNGQNGAASITLKKMVDYMLDYNSKLAQCAPSQRKDLKKVQDDPLQNKFGISRSQMVEAIRQITSNVNASLQESAGKYELVFTEEEYGFKLEFKVTADAKNKDTLSFDAIANSNSHLGITETSKWKRIIEENALIGNVSTDGAKRLKDFEAEARLTSCERALSGSLPVTVMKKPFVTFDSVNAEIEREIKLGARSNSKQGAQVANEPGNAKWVRSSLSPYQQVTSLFRGANGIYLTEGTRCQLYSGGSISWYDSWNACPQTLNLDGNNTVPGGVVTSSRTVGDFYYGVDFEGDVVKLSADKKWEKFATIDVFGSDAVKIHAPRPNIIYVLTRKGALWLFADRQWQLLTTDNTKPHILDFAADSEGRVLGVADDGGLYDLQQ